MDRDEKEVMPTQIALRFDEVPTTCPAQKRYHTIAPCLAGRCAPADKIIGDERQRQAAASTADKSVNEGKRKGKKKVAKKEAAAKVEKHIRQPRRTKYSTPEIL